MGPPVRARARGRATGEEGRDGDADTPVDVATRLAGVAREVAAEWQIELGEPFALSRYSFVAPAGDDAVLKVVPPEDDESTREAEALAFWGGDGAVRLLRHDRRRRAMLLERARPGHDAATLSDDVIPAVTLDVARRLWRTPPSSSRYDRIGERVPVWLTHVGDDDLVRRAKALFGTLTVGHDVLVHGDFHHHNLLRHGERWVAIDPKPMLGEPEFDVVTFLWNPLGSTPTRERVETAIAAFAAQGLDAARIRAWAAIRATYLGLPLRPGMSGTQVTVARMLLE